MNYNWVHFILFFLVLSLPEGLSGQPYAIGQLSITLNDPTRSNRAVPTEIYYPATVAGAGQPVAAGEFPVVVIGHGFSMTFGAYQNFWEELVPRGYIVALPKTESSAIPFPSHGDFGKDLALVAEFILAENTNSNSPVFNKIISKVAIMGHSMGGGSSFLASENNGNVTTLIAFAPAETNPSAIAAAANVAVPSLIFAGSKDNVSPPGDNATLLYNALASDCKTYVTITNGSHCQFAESNLACDFGETTVCLGCSFISRSQQHATTFRFLNPWLDFFLKGGCSRFDDFNNLLATSGDVNYQQSCNIAKPVADFTVIGDTVFCVGDSVTLTANGSYDFFWSNGVTSSEISVTTDGSYFLVAGDSYNCYDTSANQSVTVNQAMRPSVLGGQNTLCEGDSLVLALNNNYEHYTWQDQSDDSVFVVTQTEDYFVQVTDSNGCQAFSDTFSVTAFSVSEPMLEMNNDTLFATTSAPVIKWFLEDSLLPGGNASFYIPVVSGNYYVEATDSNGCLSISPMITVTFTGIHSSKHAEKVTMYPIPTSGLLYIESQSSQIELYSAWGKFIRMAQSAGQRFFLDLGGLPAGVYLIRVDGKAVNKVVKY